MASLPPHIRPTNSGRPFLFGLLWPQTGELVQQNLFHGGAEWLFSNHKAVLSFRCKGKLQDRKVKLDSSNENTRTHIAQMWKNKSPPGLIGLFTLLRVQPHPQSVASTSPSCVLAHLPCLSPPPLKPFVLSVLFVSRTPRDCLHS